MSATLQFKCSEARLRASKKYYKTHPDKVKIMSKVYYDANSDEIKTKKRDKYALMSPEEKKIKQDKEYAKQRDKQKQKRIAAKLEKKLLLLQQMIPIE